MGPGEAERPVSAVCVVGLAHANGVLARSAERGLLSSSERDEGNSPAVSPGDEGHSPPAVS